MALAIRAMSSVSAASSAEESIAWNSPGELQGATDDVQPEASQPLARP